MGYKWRWLDCHTLPVSEGEGRGGGESGGGWTVTPSQ